MGKPGTRFVYADSDKEFEKGHIPGSVVAYAHDLHYLDDVKAELHKELQPVKSELDDLSRYKPEDYIDALASGDDGEEKKPEEKKAEERKPEAAATAGKAMQRLSSRQAARPMCLIKS